MTTSVKRSLFKNKPAWAAAPTTSKHASSENESIFGRNVNFDEIVRAQTAQKAERERREQKEKERSVSHDSRRKRVAEPWKDTSEDEARYGGFDSDGVPIEPEPKPVTRSTPKKEKKLKNGLDDAPIKPTLRKGKRKSTTIDLDADDEDDELVMVTPPSRKKSTPKKTAKDELDEESEDDDPYLRELRQRAREKAQQQLAGKSTQQLSSVPPNRVEPAASTTYDDQPAITSASLPLATSVTPVPEEDEVMVRIMITSNIPNTASLIVKRKASQSLKQVKEFWCRKFNLAEDTTRQVFLTWNGTRLFDSTSMKGILKSLKRDHFQKQRAASALLSDDDEKQGEEDEVFDERTAKDPSNGMIMLVAYTPDLHAELQREKERQERQRAAQTSNDATIEEEEEVEEAPVADTAIVIRLKSKEHEMPMRVRPHTSIGKIMQAFAVMKKIAAGKTPWLVFDGERLEPDMNVEQVGFEDEDEVEVSIR